MPDRWELSLTGGYPQVGMEESLEPRSKEFWVRALLLVTPEPGVSEKPPMLGDARPFHEAASLAQAERGPQAWGDRVGHST